LDKRFIPFPQSSVKAGISDFIDFLGFSWYTAKVKK